MGIFVASLVVGILFLWRINKSHVGYMICDFAIGEKPSKVGVLEGVVVWQRDFIDVISVNEGFFESLPRLIITSSHQ